MLLTPDVQLQIITDMENHKGNEHEIASVAAATLITRGAEFKQAYQATRHYTKEVKKRY